MLAVIDGADVRLVHLSIDLVFSGSGNGGHIERDRTDPVTQYGHSMAAAERLIQMADPRACILRISLPMGVSFNGHAGAIDWIQSRFKKSLPATLYYDEIRTPTYTDCLNPLFQDMCCRGPSRESTMLAVRVRLSLFRDRANCEPHWRLRTGPAAGLFSSRSGADAARAPATSRWTLAKLARELDLRARSIAWPLDETRWFPRTVEWHYRRDSGPPGSPELLAAALYTNAARAADAVEK